MLALDIIKDALFAAVAAIGFGAISRIPRRAYLWCGLIAAIGHSLRFVLMSPALCSMNIIVATAIAAFVIGSLAVFVSPFARTPAEAYLFPSLLPMIPGMFAYKSFGGAVKCILGTNPDAFDANFRMFTQNGFICLSILTAMVIFATIPIFIFRARAFRATR